MTLPALPDQLKCHVPDYCTGIDSCVYVDQLQRGFRAHLLLDACNFKFSVGIEKLQVEQSLIDYDWGEIFSLFLSEKKMRKKSHCVC